MSQVSLTVNGKPVAGDVAAETLLVQFLRDTLSLTGAGLGIANCITSGPRVGFGHAALRANSAGAPAVPFTGPNVACAPLLVVPTRR